MTPADVSALVLGFAGLVGLDLLRRVGTEVALRRGDVRSYFETVGITLVGSAVCVGLMVAGGTCSFDEVLAAVVSFLRGVLS